MAGPGLPVGIDSTYADSATDPSIKAHQQAHDTLHAFANKFDQTAPADGQALVWSAALQLWTPGTVAGGGSGTPANGSVGTNQLADGAITSAKIADGAIVTADLADNSVTTAKIAAGAVGTVDIADGAVTAAKLAAGSVNLATVPNATLNFPLSTAKTWSSRSQVTSRTDVRIVVVGGQDESEWPAAASILLDQWDAWDLIP